MDIQLLLFLFRTSFCHSILIRILAEWYTLKQREKLEISKREMIHYILWLTDPIWFDIFFFSVRKWPSNKFCIWRSKWNYGPLESPSRCKTAFSSPPFVLCVQGPLEGLSSREELSCFPSILVSYFFFRFSTLWLSWLGVQYILFFIWFIMYRICFSVDFSLPCFLCAVILVLLLVLVSTSHFL